MASKGVNKVILIGNLGQDPDVRYTTGGEAIATISLATSESWKDKNTGDTQERTEWHRVVFFGKPAEIVEKYLRKGSKVYVEGQLRTRKWQDKEGHDRYTTEVIINGMGGSTMQMLDGRREVAADEPKDRKAPSSAPSDSGKALNGRGADQSGGMPFDDDIPF